MLCIPIISMYFVVQVVRELIYLPSSTFFNVIIDILLILVPLGLENFGKIIKDPFSYICKSRIDWYRDESPFTY